MKTATIAQLAKFLFTSRLVWGALALFVVGCHGGAGSSDAAIGDTRPGDRAFDKGSNKEVGADTDEEDIPVPVDTAAETLPVVDAAPADVPPDVSAPDVVSPQKPNIVFIMADDLGYGDLSAYGAPDIRTPHIDSLGADGLRFTQFYGHPWCLPTRAALFTGRYPQRPMQGTIASPLKAAGYTTGVVGKWHPTPGPVQAGFDYFFGFKGCCSKYFNAPRLFENDVPVTRQEYLTDVFTQEAVKFIERNKSAPFFLHVAYNAPHSPYEGPNRESPPSRAVYASMVERMDQGVGAILSALDSAGLASTTIVIFTGDNGGAAEFSRNTPLSGFKWSVDEGGIRVPALVRWPGVFRAGDTVSAPTMGFDFTASILRITESTQTSVLDGVDVLDLVAKREPVPSRALFWDYGGQTAVRDGNLKLIKGAAVNGDALFDLEVDPGEKMNLVADRPQDAARLRTLIAEWQASLTRP